MNEKQKQELFTTIAALDQFAANTPLARPWHAGWQAVYQQVLARIEVILKQPDDASDEPPQPA